MIPASDTMNWVKNNAAMAGAMCVIACIVTPTRPREFGPQGGLNHSARVRYR